MLATAHYSCGYPDNVNSLGVLNWVSFWTQLGENFRITVGFVAAAVSMSTGGCRARRLVGVSSVAVVAVDIPIAAELAVL